MNEIRLPEKPSEGILEALKHLEFYETHPDYEIDMGSWHKIPHIYQEAEHKKCHICLGGAILADFYKSPTSRSDLVDVIQIEFFDYLRRGDEQHFLERYPIYLEENAINSIVIKIYGNVPDIEFVSYEESPIKFKQYLRDVARGLKIQGL